MKEDKKCTFCHPERLLEELPPKGGNNRVHCKRGIYEDRYCFATLAPEQYTHGYAILVLRNHRADITDYNISNEELSGFISAIHKLARHLKDKLRDNNNNPPERIYVCSLCDGVQHLHAHLIPRYKFTREDRVNYREQFKERDSKEEIDEAVESGELGGFWYIAHREKNYKRSELWAKSDKERAQHLEKLASKLRLYNTQ